MQKKMVQKVKNQKNDKNTNTSRVNLNETVKQISCKWKENLPFDYRSKGKRKQMDERDYREKKQKKQREAYRSKETKFNIFFKYLTWLIFCFVLIFWKKSLCVCKRVKTAVAYHIKIMQYCLEFFVNPRITVAIGIHVCL